MFGVGPGGEPLPGVGRRPAAPAGRSFLEERKELNTILFVRHGQRGEGPAPAHPPGPARADPEGRERRRASSGRSGASPTRPTGRWSCGPTTGDSAGVRAVAAPGGAARPGRWPLDWTASRRTTRSSRSATASRSPRRRTPSTSSATSSSADDDVEGRASRSSGYNVELYPDAPNVHDSLGEALERAGRLSEAFSSYSRAVDSAADHGRSAPRDLQGQPGPGEGAALARRASLDRGPGARVRSPPLTARASSLLVAGLAFFASGASALVYQVAWQRILALHTGVGITSIAVIVASFMAGIGLGSHLGGVLSHAAQPAAGAADLRRSSRSASLSFGALSCGLYYDLLYRQGSWLYASPAVGGVLHFAGLLPPTLLMGMSLPFLVRALVHDVGRAGRTVGFLYGVNVLGASLGALVTPWLLLRFLGVRGAVMVAVAGNLVAAASVLLLLLRVFVIGEPRRLRRAGGPSAREAALRPRGWSSTRSRASAPSPSRSSGSGWSTWGRRGPRSRSGPCWPSTSWAPRSGPCSGPPGPTGSDVRSWSSPRSRRRSWSTRASASSRSRGCPWRPRSTSGSSATGGRRRASAWAPIATSSRWSASTSSSRACSTWSPPC